MTMTKIEYVAIARIINDNTLYTNTKPTQKINRVVLGRLIDGFSAYFESRNPKFDKDKFLAACGVMG